MSVIAYRKRILKIQEQNRYSPVHTDGYRKIRSSEYVDGLTTLYQETFGISEDQARKQALADQEHTLTHHCEGKPMNSEDIFRFFDENPDFLRRD